MPSIKSKCASLDPYLYFLDHTAIAVAVAVADRTTEEYLGTSRVGVEGHLDVANDDANDIRTNDSSLSVKILRICKDAAELKIAESILIRNLKPSLNIHTSSWKLIQPVQYTAT